MNTEKAKKFHAERQISEINEMEIFSKISGKSVDLEIDNPSIKYSLNIGSEGWSFWAEINESGNVILLTKGDYWFELVEWANE